MTRTKKNTVKYTTCEHYTEDLIPTDETDVRGRPIIKLGEGVSCVEPWGDDARFGHCRRCGLQVKMDAGVTKSLLQSLSRDIERGLTREAKRHAALELQPSMFDQDDLNAANNARRTSLTDTTPAPPPPPATPAVDPRAVVCPHCGASVGQDCQRPSGHRGPFVQIHAQRRSAASAAAVFLAAHAPASGAQERLEVGHA